jgi:hypothetical protein
MSSLPQKRGVVSVRRSRAHMLLVADLQELQAKHKTLRLELQDHIDHHLRQAARTRELDRQDVLNSLTNWKGAGSTVDDLVEDTGLSDSVVRGVLEELQSEGLVIVKGERSTDGERGRPAKVYDLANV